MDDLQFGAHDKRGSHILSLVRRQLPEDWTERYNTTPVLIEASTSDCYSISWNRGSYVSD